MKRYSCESCNAGILWALTPNRRRMPLDATPRPDGNVAAYTDDLGLVRARVLRQGEKPASHEKTYMPHFATCPSASQHRRKPQRKAGQR